MTLEADQGATQSVTSGQGSGAVDPSLPLYCSGRRLRHVTEERLSLTFALHCVVPDGTGRAHASVSHSNGVAWGHPPPPHNARPADWPGALNTSGVTRHLLCTEPWMMAPRSWDVLHAPHGACRCF